MDQALAAIHQGNPGRLPVQLCLAERDGSVSLFCRFADELRAVVEGQLFAHYPDARQELLPDEALDRFGEACWTADMQLRRNLFPIRSYPAFEDKLNRVTADPLSTLLMTVGQDRRGSTRSRIEIDVRPASHRRLKRAHRILKRLDTPLFAAHPSLALRYADWSLCPSRFKRIVARIMGALVGRLGRRSAPQVLTGPVGKAAHTERMEAAFAKLRHHVFEARVRLIVRGAPGAAAAAQKKMREMAGALGSFSRPAGAEFHLGPLRPRGSRQESKLGPPMLLSSEELSTLWHPATETVRSPGLDVNASRELEPPVALPTVEHETAILGRTQFRERRQLFGIRRDDRRRHLLIVGKTGMGKTTLLRQLLQSDVEAGRGIALLDPHGDLAEAVAAAIPRHRTNDVILFDAGDRGHPLSFNLMADCHPDQRSLVASGIVSAFKKIYGDSWGPRLEHVLRNALLALLEHPGTSLLSVSRLLGDAHYRAALVGRIADPVVRTFWQREFASWRPQYMTEAIAPVQNKIGQFLSHPVLRAILGQADSSLDLRRVLDEGKVLIVNLSKGRIGEDGSQLLGALLVTGLQLASMSRSDVSEERRRDFYLYVDEFQNFATESFATVLSEARKYRLNCILSHQYLGQLDEPIANAVFGNVGSLLSFQVGASDADFLAAQLGPGVEPADLMALPKYAAYVRLLIDGLPSRPFSMRTVSPSTPRDAAERFEIVRRVSRRRYARPVADVSREIERALTGSGVK
jgi:Type IV secretion-system coupling protein DNA-binding domain